MIIGQQAIYQLAHTQIKIKSTNIIIGQAIIKVESNFDSEILNNVVKVLI
ncbi:MAG: hypothetical protein MJA82_12755 [Clostridia bacterium]|nr:hypothetical protein [Clostridia bacterium]